MKRFLIFLYLNIQEFIFRTLAKNTAVHKTLFFSGFEPYRWILGKWRAWFVFEQAAQKVPAYRAFLKKHKGLTKLDTTLPLREAFEQIPSMDKDSYIKKWTIPERSLGGSLPTKGVVVDESSGSSGKPTSWVRGPLERKAVRSLLQLGFQATTQRTNKPVFILNAFSLGAWATGMNVSASLTDITIIKSTGPDHEKIAQTIREFGPDYSYVVLSYPPFLKTLCDNEDIDWKNYSIIAGFGGEGISENMRQHLLQYYEGVYGSYGASDLEINMAIETDFTIALRQEIAANQALADELTKTSEYGVLPMVFQYNPYEYYLESNSKGDLLATVTRKQNINPRIRYNIHDRGHVIRFKEIKPVLEKHGLAHFVKKQRTNMPVLFHYGRSDLSVDYNGAVVAPDTLRDVIYADAALSEIVENHRLISYEDEHANKQLHIALQLRNGATLTAAESKKLQNQIFQQLFALNKDFLNACRTSSKTVWPSMAFYNYRKGPFVTDGKKLKNEYVQHCDKEQAGQLGMKLTYILPGELIKKD